MYDILARQTLLLVVSECYFAKEIVKNICFFKRVIYIGTFLPLKTVFIIGKKVFSLGVIAWILFFLRFRN